MEIAAVDCNCTEYTCIERVDRVAFIPSVTER